MDVIAATYFQQLSGMIASTSASDRTDTISVARNIRMVRLLYHGIVFKGLLLSESLHTEAACLLLQC